MACQLAAQVRTELWGERPHSRNTGSLCLSGDWRKQVNAVAHVHVSDGVGMVWVDACESHSFG